MQFLCLAALAWLLPLAMGANILAVLPIPSKSHSILIERLLRSLDAKGHQVTYITSNEPNQPMGKTEVIFIPDMKDQMFGDPKMKNGNLLEMRGMMSPWRQIFTLAGMGLRICDAILQHEHVVKLLQSSRKFDLIFGEIFLDESLLAGLSHRFQAPIVALQTFMPGIWSNYLTGNPAPASYIPDPFLGLGTKMTFWERANNLAFGSFADYRYRNIYLPQQDAIMRKHFSNDYPPMEDILKNTSLVLVNHHYALGFPRPLLPNIIEVAGMHIDKPKPLPKDLQTYMDNSKEGVVFFSLGTNVRGIDLPGELAQAILRAFGRLKQNVIWKFEADLPNLPKNVKIQKWLPQSDILAHPNLKLFITHGGLLSTTEAVVRGVPVVGIPIFGDQPLNMKHTENAGLGKTLPFDDITEENLYNVVTEVLNNPKYAKAAKTKSQLIQDNPADPLETSIWWIEYVLRHRGAHHMRSAAQDLCWYQVHLLDVYAVVAVALLAAISTTIYVFKIVCRNIRERFFKSKKTSAKKRN